MEEGRRSAKMPPPILSAEVFAIRIKTKKARAEKFRTRLKPKKLRKNYWDSFSLWAKMS